jgi:cell division GTPase FtsZ
MHLADELIRILVCEICFENYDKQERLPLNIFPCGHTFCQLCISNLNAKRCPQCNISFEHTAKNWAIINLIPLPKLPEVYLDLKRILHDGFKLLKAYDNKINGKHNEKTSLFNQIKSEINARAEELINKIREQQEALLNRLSLYEAKWMQDYESNMGYEHEIRESLDKINQEVSLEENEQNEPKLNEMKQIASANLINLNNKYDLCQAEFNNTISFTQSNIDMIVGTFTEGYLYGELNSEVVDNLIVIDNESYVNNNNNNIANNAAYNDTTKYNLLSKIVELETYSEITSIVN